MSEPASLPPPPQDALPQSAAAGAPDPRIVRAEQRLAMLRELAELGMTLSRALTHRAVAEADYAEAADAETKAAPGPRPEPRHGPADSFARLSRAVRLTLALEATVEEQLAALHAGDVGAPAKNPFGAGSDQLGVYHRAFPGDYACQRRNKVRDVTDIDLGGEILETLHERLTESEHYDAFVRYPFKEAVETICGNLGLQPDWSGWTDDGWPPSALSPRQIWDRFWPASRQQRLKPKLQ